MASDDTRAAAEAELVELVKASFPDLRCLRCGNTDFYILFGLVESPLGTPSWSFLESPVTDKENPVLVLACARCGHVEQHLTGVLRRAEKPVPIANP